MGGTKDFSVLYYRHTATQLLAVLYEAKQCCMRNTDQSVFLIQLNWLPEEVGHDVTNSHIGYIEAQLFPTSVLYCFNGYA